MSVSVQTQLANFNAQAARAAIEADIRERVTRAAFEYIQTALSIIPVYAGASQGTFTALADAINSPLIINPEVSSEIGLGVDASTGGVDLTGPVFSFEYSTSLPRLVFNESNNANEVGFNLRNPGPYQFVEASQNAAMQAFDTPITFSSNFITPSNRTFRLG